MNTYKASIHVTYNQVKEENTASPQELTLYHHIPRFLL